jgi:hypothetical protein
MSGRLDAVVEAFTSNIASYDPGPGDGEDFDQFMRGLPGVFDSLGQAIKSAAEHFKGNPSINDKVTETMDELANAASGISKAADETLQSHAANHGLWIG